MNFDMDKVMEVMEMIQADSKESTDFFDFLLIQVMKAKQAHEEGNGEHLATRLKLIAESTGVIAEASRSAVIEGYDLPDDIPAPTLIQVPSNPGPFKGFNSWRDLDKE